MNKLIFFIIANLLFSSQVLAQVGINTDGTSPDNSAMLDVKSTSKGFLPPRITTLQRYSIVTPAAGLVIYNVTGNRLNFFNGTNWLEPFDSTFFLTHIAIGANAGQTTQGTNSIALGLNSGYQNQGVNSIAMGVNAGKTAQSSNSIALGLNSGYQNQGSNSIAMGSSAGLSSQGINSIAMGVSAGFTTQGSNSIALGPNSGYQDQGSNSIAIGNDAGKMFQGDNAVAIGYRAGSNSQASNSIILNASGTLLDTPTSGFYVNPLRGGGVGSNLSYDVVTNEITYNTSDARLKRNIQPISRGLAIVMQLKPVSYEKKYGLIDTEYPMKEIGFIAQDIQKILPMLVQQIPGKDSLLTLNYIPLIPILVKSLQEQQVLIEAQQKQIDELKEVVRKMLKK